MLEELVKIEARVIWDGWKLNCLIAEAQECRKEYERWTS